MKIKAVFFSKGQAGYFFDDQTAIKTGLEPDGFLFRGSPQTPGYDRVRVPSESISVLLVLEDGQLAIGDCCAVQYSGVGGRDPLLVAAGIVPWMETHLIPELVGRSCAPFKENAEFFDSFQTREGKLLHTAIRYGVTQALLDAAAKSACRTIAEVAALAYHLPIQPTPVRIFAQSGDDRYTHADKMILKEVDVLPHGLINDPHTKVGINGEKLEEYVFWLKNRILKIRKDDSYRPELHLDVYGTLGIVFDNDLTRIVDYMGRLEAAASPFPLRIESPVDFGSREGQMEGLKKITERITQTGLRVEIVADEWCNTLEDIKLFADEGACHMIQIKTPDLGGIHNTIEAVCHCKERGIKAYQGGTCTETDISARICTQIAIAAQPYQILAKPGMGMDEGFMIVKNEMARTLLLLDKA